MRIYQTWRDYLAQVLLVGEPPVIGAIARRRLVDAHTETYVERSERDAAARRPRLRAAFEIAMDAYVAASNDGYPEAQARELTHVLATWDFIAHGWGELIEFPPDEATAYHDRYRPFYDRYGCSPADPFGEFEPATGLPAAPETPERLDGEYPMAEPGLADQVYVLADRLNERIPGGTAAKGAVDARGE
ncbi:MAG: DUF6149 family protein [Haloarculaceae archaeon]